MDIFLGGKSMTINEMFVGQQASFAKTVTETDRKSVV